MSQYDNIIELRKYKHLTAKERYKIEILLKEGLKPYEMHNEWEEGPGQLKEK